VRILKHLLTIDDPAERAVELENALQPGAPLETPTQDFLSTQPRTLLVAAETVLAAFDESKNTKTLLGQTADLMNPTVILRLREIVAQIKARWL